MSVISLRSRPPDYSSRTIDRLARLKRNVHRDISRCHADYAPVRAVRLRQHEVCRTIETLVQKVLRVALELCYDVLSSIFRIGVDSKPNSAVLQFSDKTLTNLIFSICSRRPPRGTHLIPSSVVRSCLCRGECRPITIVKHDLHSAFPGQLPRNDLEDENTRF